MEYNFGLEKAKYNFLNNELEGYPEEIVQFLSEQENYFTNDFIHYMLDESAQEMDPTYNKYTRKFNCSKEQLVSKGILDAMSSTSNINKKELLQALIMFNVDVQEFISMLPENEQKQLNSIIKELVESGSVKPYRICEVMESKDFKEFLSANEDMFSDSILNDILNKKNDVYLSERLLKILVKNSSLDACLYYYDQGKIADNIIDLKKQVIERNKAISERNDRIKRVESINPSEYTEADVKVLVEDLSAGQLYDKYKEGLIGEDVVKRRQEFDKNIINNASSYSERTVAEAIAGLYFQDSVRNVRLDLSTIVNYCESKKLENPETIAITRLYEFFSGKTKFNNQEDYQYYIGNITKFLSNFDYSRMNEIIEQYTVEFENELEERLGESKEKVFSNENLIKVDGVDVPVYKLQNLTESQRNFLLLVHTESYEKVKQNNQREYPGMSLSILDDEHLHLFSDGIIFGYDDLENGRIVAVNTFDGQTNQRGIFNSENNKVMAKQLYSVDDYMKNTDNEAYNEIALKFADQKVKPKYIISVHDKLTEEEIEIANLYKLPILMIDREKYHFINKEKIVLSISNDLYYDKTYGRLIERKKYPEQKKDEKEAIDLNDRNTVSGRDNVSDIKKAQENER